MTSFASPGTRAAKMAEPKKYIKLSLEQVSHAAVIIGVILAVWGFLMREADRRSETALVFLQTFQDADMAAARQQFRAYWMAQPLAALSGRPGSAGVIDALAMEHVFGSTEATAVFLRQIENLDLIGSCVEGGLCDAETIDNQIGDYATDFLCLYRRPIEELQSQHLMRDIGHAARHLVDGTGC